MINQLPSAVSDLIVQLLRQLPADNQVYLVGGAVRDLLRGQPIHDIDLLMQGDVLKVSRRLADAVGAAYYPLDEVRQTARIIRPYRYCQLARC